MSETIVELFPYSTGLNEIVAGNIRAEIARRNVDQSEVGAVIGVNQATVSKKMKGRVRWHLEDIEAIAEFLDMEPYELLIPHPSSKKAGSKKAARSQYTARDSNPEPID